MENYYRILGLDNHSTLKQIKRAYRELSLKWHPDKINQSGHLAKNREEAEEKFKEINEAYQKKIPKLLEPHPTRNLKRIEKEKKSKEKLKELFRI